MTTEPITVSRVSTPSEPSSQVGPSIPDVPLVEIYKLLGARAPNWKRTCEALITAFQTLETTAECGHFRSKNSATINQ